MGFSLSGNACRGPFSFLSFMNEKIKTRVMYIWGAEMEFKDVLLLSLSSTALKRCRECLKIPFIIIVMFFSFEKDVYCKGQIIRMQATFYFFHSLRCVEKQWVLEALIKLKEHLSLLPRGPLKGQHNLFLTHHKSNRHVVTKTGTTCVRACVLVDSWPKYTILTVYLSCLQCLTMAMRRPWGVPLSAWKERVILQRVKWVLCCPAVL